MAKSISNVGDRDALKPRREPYWHKIEKGCYLGFRKMTASTDGTWVARHRDDATHKTTLRALGAFDDLPPNKRFDAAQKAAREWFVHLGRGGSTDKITVGEACKRYVAHLRAEKRDKTADDAQARFKRHVNSDKIAEIDLQQLGRRHLLDWRKRLAAKPAPVSRAPGAEGRERSKASLNRDMSALRAALNLAHKEGAVTTSDAWEAALVPAKDATRRRTDYLDADQRRALIAAAEPEIARFLRGLNLLPLRPGALAALKVSDFNAKLGTLRIGRDKAGAGRTIALPEPTAAFLAGCAKDKLPATPLIAREGGKGWSKDAWKWPIKEAVQAAGLSESVTAYTLRHSVITDLVSLHGLDLLTVAQLSGTSVQMIELHYGHLLQEQARNALAKLATH